MNPLLPGPAATDAERVRPQALLMTALGTPVLAGIAVAAPVLVARLWGSALLDGPFWLGSAVFGGFSLIALGLILRAARRVQRTGEKGVGATLARWSPVLMLIGGAAGAFVAGRIADDALKLRAEIHAEECRTIVGEGADLSACLAAMTPCDLETRGGPGITTDRSGALSVDWPDGLELPGRPTTRARVLCAWRALRAESPPRP